MFVCVCLGGGGGGGAMTDRPLSSEDCRDKFFQDDSRVYHKREPNDGLSVFNPIASRGGGCF